MDPTLQAALQMLQEAQQVMAMQAEEIQTLRQGSKKLQEQQPMQKKASVSSDKLAMLVGMRAEDLPEFIKTAEEDEVRSFMSNVELRARHNSIGKIAEIYDGSQAETPAEQLEATLSGLIG
jgi:hypothetical protein